MRRLLLVSFLAVMPALAYAQTETKQGPMLPPAGPPHFGMTPDQHLMMAFYAANTTHDGHLTLAQAKAAKLERVADHFSEIDVAKRGYVTFYDIEAWRLDRFAEHLEEQANELRAKDK